MASNSPSDASPISDANKASGDLSSTQDSPRSKRAPWTQIVRGESDHSSSTPTLPPPSTASSSTSSSVISEEENTENGTLPIPGNAIKKPAWNKPINESPATVIGGECWPPLSESARVSSKSADASSSTQPTQRSVKPNGNGNGNRWNSVTNGTGGERATQFRGNAYRNRGNARNGNTYPRPTPRFMRAPPPPPPLPLPHPHALSHVPTSAPFMMTHPPVRHFGPHMPFPMFYVPPAVPFYPPPAPVIVPSADDAFVRSELLRQIDYYFSTDNLAKDVYLRQQMDRRGWVPISVIAGFNKVKELTNNLQVIVDVVRGSTVVELEGERMRRRDGWWNWLLPEMRRPTSNDSIVNDSEGSSLENHSSG